MGGRKEQDVFKGLETVEIFYNDTDDHVSKRVSFAVTVTIYGDLLSGIDAETRKAFAIPLARIVRIEGAPDAVRRIVERLPAGQTLLVKEGR